MTKSIEPLEDAALQTLFAARQDVPARTPRPAPEQPEGPDSTGIYGNLGPLGSGNG